MTAAAAPARTTTVIMAFVQFMFSIQRSLLLAVSVFYLFMFLSLWPCRPVASKIGDRFTCRRSLSRYVPPSSEGFELDSYSSLQDSRFPATSRSQIAVSINQPLSVRGLRVYSRCLLPPGSLLQTLVKRK